MKAILTLLIHLFFSILLLGQTIDHSYIIRVADDAESFISKVNNNNRSVASKASILSKNLNIVHIYSEDKAFIDQLHQDPNVLYVEKDAKLELRNTPNDPGYSQQYDMRFSGISELWNITTGGKNAMGHDIVIGVIDNGFDVEHEDIKNNLYINTKEVPDDNIDNDNNGYIDDYIGYHAVKRRGNVNNKFPHGTSVSGIVGAEGNNNIGVTGTNWNIKIIPIIGVTVPAIIHGYDYLLSLRKKYNESSGAEGAFVVSINLSQGIYGRAEQYKSWCDMYEALGKAGILNPVAVPNDPEDIDIKKDMPSDCSSNSIISVTNTDRNDALHAGKGAAAWGATKVDLGAPGHDTYTIFPNDKYGAFGGTSSATPHVAGAIALIHSLPCDGITKQSIENPYENAVLIKNAILTSVKPLESLKGKTVSGGRLDAFAAAKKLKTICPDLKIPSPKGKLSIQTIARIGQNLLVDYISPDEKQVHVRLQDMSGRTFYSELHTPQKYGGKFVYIPVDILNTGIYIISLNTGSRRAIKKYFLTQK